MNIEKELNKWLKMDYLRRNLRDKKKLNALNTVDKEIFNFFNGDCTKEEAINLIKKTQKNMPKGK